MSDERGEPNPMTEEPAPDSRLTGRLLSRATDSLGLIDVRGAEQHYARIMDWLAARTPLLEHLRTRYGLTEGEGMTGLAFAEARVPEGARLGGEGISLSAAQGINLSAAQGGLTAPDAEQIFTRVAHIPDDPAAAPTEAKRIARRGVPTFSPASPETGASANRVRGEAARQEDVARQGRDEVFRPALGLAGPTQEQARGLQSPHPFKEAPAANAEGHGARPADAAQTSRPRPASNPAPESTPSPARRTTPSVEERVSDSTAEQDRPLARGGAPFTDAVGSGTNVARGPTGTNDAAVVNDSTDANEPSRAAKPGAVRVAESPGPSAPPRVPTPLAPVGTRERGSATGAVVVDEAKPTTLNRTGTTERAQGVAEGAKRPAEGAKAPASEPADVGLPVASETRAASASAETPRTLAQAREVRTHAREVHAGGAGRASESLHTLPLAQNAAAAAERAEPSRRQNDSAPAVTRASSGGAEAVTPGRAAAPARADGINVQSLTEQVSRHLARRLLVERERRGLGRR